MDSVKTAGHLNRQVPLTGTPNDGNSSCKRQPPISPPPLSSSRGGYPSYHLDLGGRFQPSFHHNQALYRDGGGNVYQVVESPQETQFRENDHHHHPQVATALPTSSSQQQIPPAAQQQQQQQHVSYPLQHGRRRPSLLPPSSDYSSAYNRERNLDHYAAYYDRELSANAGMMPAHGYQAVMSGPMDAQEHHHHHHHQQQHHPHLTNKRPRLTIMGDPKGGGGEHRPLGIDTEIKREPAYNPQVEAISPTLPPDDYHQESSPLRASRDELLQQIGKVDREIAKTETQIQKLKKKQQELEMAAAKPDTSKHEPADNSAIDATKHQSVPQIIYAENRKKAQESHDTLAKLGPKIELPLYNQPSDTASYHENKKTYLTFKKRLMAHFKKRHQERQIREKYLTDTYNKLMQQWLKKVERIENNVKRKVKDAKSREFFEKQFPELKKQREDKERFSRPKKAKEPQLSSPVTEGRCLCSSQPSGGNSLPRTISRVSAGGPQQTIVPPPPPSSSSLPQSTAGGGNGGFSSSSSSNSSSSSAAATSTRKARLTQGSSGQCSLPSRVGTRIRSDAELEEIMDGLQEQELEDKKMRSYAVIPPILLDARQRRISFHNENCLVEDPMTEYKDRPLHNIWTKPEKDIFKEKYLQHPKNFGLIASYLERKSVADCVQYYYLTKKNENYKQLLRKHNVRKKRFPKPQQPAAQPNVGNQPGGVITRQGASTAPTTDESSKPTLAPSSGSGSSICGGSSVSAINTASDNANDHNSGGTACNTANGGGNGNGGSIGGGNSGGGAGGSGNGGCNSGNNGNSNREVGSGAESHEINGPSEKTDGKESGGGDKEGTNDDETGDDQSEDNEGINDNQVKHGVPHPCSVCKTVLEHFGQSRPVTVSTCHLYGLKEDDVTPDTRVCSSCRCRSVRSRYTHCPILSCRTPKRKVKRLRPLPGKWSELPAEIKDPIISDLQIPLEVTKCCSACFNRIARRLGTNPTTNELVVPLVADNAETSRWTEEEMEVAKHGLRDHGTNWTKISGLVVTKTEAQCKNFYFNYRRKLGLDSLVQENRKSKGLDKDGQMPPIVTDEEESGETTSSCEEFNGPEKYDSSDTASAPSPAGKNMDDVIDRDSSLKDGLVVKKGIGGGVNEVASLLHETKDLSASRGSLKSNPDIPDYDSSATVSADEGPSQLDSDVLPLTSSGSHLNKLERTVVGGSAPLMMMGQSQRLVCRRPDESGSTPPTFLDDARVKALLSQVQDSASRNEQLGGVPQMSPAQFLFSGPSKKQDCLGEKDGPIGDIVVTKTVRDLIDQAIDTSFPNGSGGRILGSSALSAANMPHIQDVLRRYEKPAGMKMRDNGRDMMSLAVVQQLQQQPQSLQPQPQSLPPSLLQHHPHVTHVDSHPPPPPPPLPSPIQHRTQLNYHHLQQQQQLQHHSHRQQQPSPQPIPMRESVPAVSYYVPDEQYKAEDLSMKRDRTREPPPLLQQQQSRSEFGKQPFRQPVAVVQKPSEVARHPAHPGHQTGERMLGAPPPAHSNQYSRSSEPSHLPAEGHRDAYHMMRAAEPRTKSPSAFVGDRGPPHIPPPAAGVTSQRSSSPHVLYLSQRRSPPSSSSAPYHKNSGMKGSNSQPPPPLVSAPKLSPKPDKICQMPMPPSGYSGSITHGTPVNHSGGGGVPLSHATSRYEDLVRHIPPPNQKEGGSITLGTPVQHDAALQKRIAISGRPDLSGGQPQFDPGVRGGVLVVADGVPRGAYERNPVGDQYYRRMSPPANYPYGTAATYPYARPPFATESQLSSRQTIMTDYYISQQMQARRNSGPGEKEARLSPRARDSSPQGMMVDHRMHPMYSYPPPQGGGLPHGAYLHSSDSRLGRHSSSPMPYSPHETGDNLPINSSPSGSGNISWSRGPSRSPGIPPSHSTPPPLQSRGVIRTTMSSAASIQPGVSKMKGGGNVTGSVIQSPKPASPRLEMDPYSGLPPPKGTPSPRHGYAHGHDAFSALVDVALSQTNLSLSKEMNKHHQHPIAMISPGPHGHRAPSREDAGRPVGHMNSQLQQERHGVPEGLPFDATDRERRIRAMYANDGPPPPVSHYVHSEYERKSGISGAGSGGRYKVPSASMGSRERPHDSDVSGRERGTPPQNHPMLHPHHPPPPPPPPTHHQRRPSPPQEDLRRRQHMMDSYGAAHVQQPHPSSVSNSSVNPMDRDPNKLLFDALEKDPPKEVPSASSAQTPLTAAKLIDAIISHQINQVTPLRGPQTGRRAEAGGNGNNGSYSKSVRHSPDSGGNANDGRPLSPYKLSRPGVSSKISKEELIVTLDDGGDREVVPAHPLSRVAGSPGAISLNYVERPSSQGGCTPQPSPSPGAGQLHMVDGKLTLKERIDLIINKDYHSLGGDPQAVAAAMQYNRNRSLCGDGGVVTTSSGGSAPSVSRFNMYSSLVGGQLLSPLDSSDGHRPQARSSSPEDHATAAQYHSWKLRRALQQDKERQREQQQQKSPPSSTASPHPPPPPPPLPSRSLANPDERQIIRIAQSASPRPSEHSKPPVSSPSSANLHMQHSRSPPSQPAPLPPPPPPSSYQIEPISPPVAFAPDSNVGEPSSTTTSHAGQPPSSWMTSPNIKSLLTTHRIYQPPDSSEAQAGHQKTPPQQIKLSPLDYVKHKIVEEMRKSSEEGPEGDGRPGSQPPLGSPRGDERGVGYAAPMATEKEISMGLKYRTMDVAESSSLVNPFSGPASQYVPGAIYHHPHHQMEPPRASSRGSNLEAPRPPYKRNLEVMEASGSSERRDGRPGSSSSVRSRSISPSSSDVAEETPKKRSRMGDQHAPESSTERSRQQSLPESSEGMTSMGGSGVCSSNQAESGNGRVTEGLSALSASATAGPSSSAVSASGVRTTSSSPDYPQSSRKEGDEDCIVAHSSMRGGGGGVDAKTSNPWDDDVGTSVKEDKSGVEASQMVDSPQSGEMVIDESAAIDSASSSKLEPVSPPPQEGISTSERPENAYSSTEQASSSNCMDVGQSVSSSHRMTETTRGSPGTTSGSSSNSSSYPNTSISSTVSGNAAAFPSTNLVSSMGGVSTTYTYPFSALSVRSLAAASPASPSSGAVANTPSSTQPPPSLSESSRSNSPVSASRDEPAPLMSSQYEPLSDED